MEPTHHLLPNVRFTKLRSSEGKSTVRKQVGQVKGNKNKATTDSLHRFLPNVRFTELRSREGKSTVRIDRKPRLMVVSN